jgi:predicted nucleic acid-binding protein
MSVRRLLFDTSIHMRHRRLYGALRERDHVNDLLILLSAARAQARVVTENAQQFRDAGLGYCGRWVSVLSCER